MLKAYPLFTLLAILINPIIGFSQPKYLMTRIGILTENSNDSRAYKINNAGQVVGGETIEGNGSIAFIWDHANGLVNLDPLLGAGQNSFAYDINNHGQITGYVADPNSIIRPFIYDPNSGVTFLNVLSNGPAEFGLWYRYQQSWFNRWWKYWCYGYRGRCVGYEYPPRSE